MGCPCHSDIHDIDVIDILHQKFFTITVFEKRLAAPSGQAYVIYSVGNTFQSGSIDIRLGPSVVERIEFHLCHGRKDNIRKIQTLGLVDCHYTHGIL